MLSFDVSAIDIVLAAALIILLSLQLSKRTQSAASQVKFRTEEASFQNNELKSTSQANVNKEIDTSNTLSKCVHSMGYLQSVPKNSPIPDECFGCAKVMSCLFHKET